MTFSLKYVTFYITSVERDPSPSLLLLERGALSRSDSYHHDHLLQIHECWKADSDSRSSNKSTFLRLHMYESGFFLGGGGQISKSDSGSSIFSSDSCGNLSSEILTLIGLNGDGSCTPERTQVILC